MSEEKIKTRLHRDGNWSQGETVELSRDQAHQLKSVLRLSLGSHIALFNDKAGEWVAEISELGKKGASARLLRQLRAPGAEPDIWLVPALIKKQRFDLMVEKAVELGVSRLCPITTQHGQVGQVKRERLEAQLREAAEQCERLSLPVVEGVQSLQALLSNWDPGRKLLVCVERQATVPLSKYLSEQKSDGKTQAWAVMTGPEGGFAESELDALDKLSFVNFVSLGPRILRAETAALVALSLWQASLGDFEKLERR